MNFLDKINSWMVGFTNNVVKPIFGRVVVAELFALAFVLLLVACLIILIVKYVRAKNRNEELFEQKFDAIRSLDNAKRQTRLAEIEISKKEFEVAKQKIVIDSQKAEIKELTDELAKAKKVESEKEMPKAEPKPIKKKGAKRK